MKQHYEKVIVACCFLFLFANVGLPSTSFNVYQPYIIATEGVGDVGGSLILSVRTLTSLVTVIFVDRYYQALDVRRGVFAACLSTALGFFIYSQASSLAAFALGAVFAGAGYGLGGMVGLTLLISRWYDHGVGGAIGFATLGSGVASIIIPICAVRVIEGSSLHLSFFLEALLALAIGALVFVFLRNRPSDIGRDASVRQSEKTGSKEQATGSVALDAAERVALLAAMAFIGCLCVGGSTYYSVLLTTQGFDPHFAATTLSAIGAMLTVSKLATGKMFDRFGVRKSSTFAFFVFLAGFALSLLTPLGNTGLAVVAGMSIGWGEALGTVGLSVWSLQLANPEKRERSIKNAQVAYSLGGFVINAIPGPLATLTGTYLTTYAIMFGMCVFAAVVITGTYKKHLPTK